ncbi:NACHT domain-containing protein [Actinokineospora inagensis]|uniref:NACHT domain-containing protein n=1 Tax=Actinokineospora inagensis TaxID=103730 RepID=UPI0004136178|nr:hypothetical protein [Actinokineospora inagensis]
MADTHNEISGGQFGGPVVQARRIGRIVVNAGPVDPAEYPPLAGWGALPEITPALADLLEAQREAVDTLPYRLLGVRRPELAKVYVQQRIRARDDAGVGEDGRGSGEGAERPLSAGEALDRGGHLIVMGEPGAGKSTLGHMYVQQICDCWLGVEGAQPPLTEPVLPLRVPARALAADRTWSELLADGVRDTVGRLLTSAPDPALFSRRAFGARWLVFIDGLDEIADGATREQVIRAITIRMRRSEHYRMVVTTRPLPNTEMAPFDQVGAHAYTIQPFGAPELDEFATAWFRAQNALTARDRAAEFVRQVGDGRLRELVRNPLLATITAIAHTLEPHRELPRSTASLYQRFMDYLLTDDTSGRRTRDELRRTLEHSPDRLALATWVDDHRVDLIEALAVVRLDTDTPLFDAARDWVLAAQTGEPPSGWEEDMRALLTSSGVFVRTEETLRFSHQSFAEFLAARSHARAIGPEFTDMDDWIARGLLPVRQNHALFTFLLWGLRGNELGLVLRRLLERGTDHVLLAGKLLTGDLPVDAHVATEIIDRLVDALVVAGAVLADPDTAMRRVRDVLSTVGVHREIVLRRVARVRDNADLLPNTRVEAATTIGLLDDRVAAADWLTEFATDVEPDVLVWIADGINSLTADSGRRIERLVSRLARTRRHDYVVTFAHIAVLADAKLTTEATELAREFVAAIRADPRTDTDPHLVPLCDSTVSVPMRFRDSWGRRVSEDDRYTWAGIAARLEELNLPDDAAWAAHRSLSAENRISEFTEAATVLLAVEGATAVSTIVKNAAARSIQHLLACADLIREHNPPVAAHLAARSLTCPGDLTRAQTDKAVTIALAGGYEPDELATSVFTEQYLKVYDRAQFAYALSVRGHRDQVRAYLRELVERGSLDRYEYWWVVDTLVRGGTADDREYVLADVQHRSPQHIAQAAPVLHRVGDSATAARLLRQVIACRPPTRVLLEVVDDLGTTAPPDLRDELLAACVARIDGGECRDLNRLAVQLDKAGRPEAADMFRRALFHAMNTENAELPKITAAWLTAQGVHAADHVVREVLDRDLPAPLRLEVSIKVAEFGALPQAVRLWIDIALHHGEATGPGFTATNWLIRTGHRSTVDLAIADALARGALSAPAQARLHALRAWVAATG